MIDSDAGITASDIVLTFAESARELVTMVSISSETVLQEFLLCIPDRFYSIRNLGGSGVTTSI